MPHIRQTTGMKMFNQYGYLQRPTFDFPAPDAISNCRPVIDSVIVDL